MCSVSAVMDYGRRNFWPDWQRQPWTTQPFTPPQRLPPVPATVPEDALRQFLKLVEAAKEYDAKTGQPNCEDPLKMEVLKRIEERLDAIERRLAQ